MNRQLLGTALLTLTGYGFAWLRLRERLRYADLSEALANAFRRMRVQTATLLQPLPVQLAAEAARSNASAAFFRVLLKHYRSGIPFRQAWETSVRQIAGLPNDVLAVLLPLGEVLGACAAETQSDALQYAADALLNQANTLKAEAKRRGNLELRLFPILSLTAALLLWK